MFANDISCPPFQEAGRPNDTNNFQPRLGFAYQLTDRTVVRGGRACTTVMRWAPISRLRSATRRSPMIQYNNDGRADFAREPDQRAAAADLRSGAAAVLQFAECRGLCGVAAPRNFTGAAPCLLARSRNSSGRRSSSICRGRVRPRSASSPVRRARWPSRRITSTARGRDEKDVVDNINLAFNPATGANYPSHDRARLPDPDWGIVSMNAHTGPLRLSRAADQLHQAVQRPLAGVGDLHAVGPLERGHAAVQRPGAGAVRDAARSRR